MYMRNILAAASFVAMVASAALPQAVESRDTAWVEGLAQDCIDTCNANGTSNMDCYGSCPRCNAFVGDNCARRSAVDGSEGWPAYSG